MQELEMTEEKIEQTQEQAVEQTQAEAASPVVETNAAVNPLEHSLELKVLLPTWKSLPNSTSSATPRTPVCPASVAATFR